MPIRRPPTRRQQPTVIGDGTVLSDATQIRLDSAPWWTPTAAPVDPWAARPAPTDSRRDATTITAATVIAAATLIRARNSRLWAADAAPANRWS